MSKVEKESALVTAAVELDQELKRFDELCLAARKVPLTSEKNLERAARACQEVAESQERLGLLARTLMDALNAARGRQEEGAVSVSKRIVEIENQSNTLQSLLKRFGVLGEQASVLNTRMQETMALHRERVADPSKGAAQLEEALADVRVKMDAIVDGATSLATDAEASEMQDVARNAEGLRQQITAARNRLGLLATGLTKKENGAS